MQDIETLKRWRKALMQTSKTIDSFSVQHLAYASLRELDQAIAEVEQGSTAGADVKQVQPTTYEEVMLSMNALRIGTLEQQQIYDVMKNKTLYTTPPLAATSKEDSLAPRQPEHATYTCGVCGVSMQMEIKEST